MILIFGILELKFMMLTMLSIISLIFLLDLDSRLIAVIQYFIRF